MAIRFRRRRQAQNEVIGTYSFPSRTVQVLRTEDNRILWTCDCEKFRRGAALTRAPDAARGRQPGARGLTPRPDRCRALPRDAYPVSFWRNF